jgi:hypothetical protein
MVQRQEVVNVVLAQVLQGLGLIAAPEQVLKRHHDERKLPDVLVDFQGLRLVIEAEYENGNVAKNKAYSAALRRVEEGVAHLGVAVVYPKNLKSHPFETLQDALESAVIEFAVLTEVDTPGVQRELFPDHKPPVFESGTVTHLAEVLRRSFDQLSSDVTLERVVELLQQQIHRLTSAIDHQPASISRMANVLGIRAGSARASGKGNSGFDIRQSQAILRVAGLIMANALIFQEVLAAHEPRVRSVTSLFGQGCTLAIGEHWSYIVAEINYYPIFSSASQLAKCLTADSSVDGAMEALMRACMQIVACKAALRHDLAGRIYHRLLEEAKYLGAYYTSIPAATLLLKLAIRADAFSTDWSSVDAIKGIHVADLACGTGTLLMAAADSILDNHIRASIAAGRLPKIAAVQKCLVEQVIYGFDVLPSAVHLTASTLTLRVPDQPINVTNLYRLDLGGASNALGTLEFLDKFNPVGTLFSQPDRVGGKSAQVASSIAIPSLNVCAMNPPFVRSVGGNLLFGNLPDAERSKMQTRLKTLLRGKPANITAGLGSPFVYLADQYISKGGCLALVLPRALTSGVSWSETRELINKNYDIEYLIVSHDPSQWNFSENTSLGEVLLVARKRDGTRKLRTATFVNIWRQPKTPVEAMGLGKAILDSDPPHLVNSDSVLELAVSGRKFGEIVAFEQSELASTWALPLSFAQTELNRHLSRLVKGVAVRIKGRSAKVPLTSLESLGKLGYDVRDIADGFENAAGKTKYPAVWGHDTERITSMLQAPNHYLKPLASAKPGRRLKSASDVWGGAGQLLIAERLRLNTARVSAVRSTVPVLSNMWWPFTPLFDEAVDQRLNALALWLNSTWGIMLLLGSRVDTEGSWVKFKKPLLNRMPVLDVRGIPASAVTTLSEKFESVSSRNCEPIRNIAGDSLRQEVDETIEKVLGLPGSGDLRARISREPIFSRMGVDEFEEQND